MGMWAEASSWRQRESESHQESLILGAIRIQSFPEGIVQPHQVELKVLYNWELAGNYFYLSFAIECE